jgi:hypothetical protein
MNTCVGCGREMVVVGGWNNYGKALSCVLCKELSKKLYTRMTRAMMEADAAVETINVKVSLRNLIDESNFPCDIAFVKDAKMDGQDFGLVLETYENYGPAA